MAQKVSLSLIIPVYNEEHHIRKCLESIAAQDDMPDEVLVVDNNSTDQTVQIAKEFSFVTVLHEKKQGVIFPRDKGFNAAKNDIIGRIDGDTFLPPHWTATVKRLLRNENYAAVNGPVFYYDQPSGRGNYWIDHQVRIHLYKGAPKAPFLFGSNSALRRSAWERVRDNVCHARTIHEDLDLAIHLMLADQHILYDKSMLAGTSSRRYHDSLAQWRLYMTMYMNTYQRHDLGGIGPRAATLLYWIGFFIFKPIGRLYDPVTGQASLKNLPKKRRARKNPMADL